MRLSLEPEVGKAIVAKASTLVEGKGTVIVDPWCEPKNRGPTFVGDALSLREQPCANLRACEGFLNVEAQQFGLCTSRGEFVPGSKRDLSEADHVAFDLGYKNACV